MNVAAQIEASGTKSTPVTGLLGSPQSTSQSPDQSPLAFLDSLLAAAGTDSEQAGSAELAGQNTVSGQTSAGTGEQTTDAGQDGGASQSLTQTQAVPPQSEFATVSTSTNTANIVSTRMQWLLNGGAANGTVNLPISVGKFLGATTAGSTRLVGKGQTSDQPVTSTDGWKRKKSAADVAQTAPTTYASSPTSSQALPMPVQQPLQMASIALRPIASGTHTEPIEVSEVSATTAAAPAAAIKSAVSNGMAFQSSSNAQSAPAAQASSNDATPAQAGNDSDEMSESVAVAPQPPDANDGSFNLVQQSAPVAAFAHIAGSMPVVSTPVVNQPTAPAATSVTQSMPAQAMNTSLAGQGNSSPAAHPVQPAQQGATNASNAPAAVNPVAGATQDPVQPAAQTAGQPHQATSSGAAHSMDSSSSAQNAPQQPAMDASNLLARMSSGTASTQAAVGASLQQPLPAQPTGAPLVPNRIDLSGIASASGVTKASQVATPATKVTGKTAKGDAAGPMDSAGSTAAQADSQTDSDIKTAVTGDHTSHDVSAQDQTSVSDPVQQVAHTVTPDAHLQGVPNTTPTTSHTPSPSAALDQAAGGSRDGNTGALASPATEAQPAINTAKLIQNMGQTEMRVGMRSAEFGDISIRTSSTRDTISAQISLDHADLARTLTTHLPEMQTRLSNGQNVDVRINTISQSNGTSAGANTSSDNSRGGNGQQQSQNGPSSYARSFNMAQQFTTAVAPVAATDNVSAGRLSIRA